MKVLSAFSAVWFLIAASDPAQAQADLGYSVSLPPETVYSQRVSPGAHAVLSFVVYQNGPGTGVGRVRARDYNAPAFAGYEFIPSPTACGAPFQIIGPVGIRMIEFPVASAGQYGTVQCTYRIRKRAGALGDLKFTVCARGTEPFCFLDRTFRIGDLPDLSLRVEAAAPVAAGQTEALVRVVVANHSSLHIASRGVATECREFGGGFFFPSPFEVENDFPGACESDEQPSPGCVNFDFQNFETRRYRLRDIAAGSERSCLLRLRLVSPLSYPVEVGFGFGDDVVQYPGGTIGFDTDLQNDTTPLGTGPVAISAVPLGRGFAALLAIAIGTLGLAASRNRLARRRRS